MRIALFSLLAAGLLPAQSLKIYSEFQRVDPFGNVVAVDRVERPREILSPAVARNAWASFHLAVTVPENTPSFLYIQQNPEWFQVTVYKEQFEKTSRGWIPDRLEKVTPPCMVMVPETPPIPKQTTVPFWLDIRVPENTEVGRMRLQAVLKSGDLWLVYPMEVRVTQAVVPKLGPVAGALPPVTARADASVAPGRPGGRPLLSIRQLIRRNATQDRALAKALKVEPPPAPKELGAEGYLKVRDFLLRYRGRE